jgi:hypothetical protein
MYLQKLYWYNGNCYLILRELPHHTLTDKAGKVIPEVFTAWKAWLGADHVLKNKTHFIFCETVPEVEFEEIKNNEQPEH